MNLFKNKIASNAMWIIIGKVVQSVLALVINMLTARYLGPSNYGLISYAASVVAFVVPIMNLGFSNVLVQELTNHPEEEGKIVGSSILLSIISAFACITGVTGYTFIADKGEPVTHAVVLLYSLILIFQAFELIQYWFQAKLLSKYMSVISLIAYVLVSTYKIVLLATGANVYWFALSYSIDYFLIAIGLFIAYKKLGGERISFSSQVGKRMFASSKYYIVSSLMVTIFAQTDKIMLKLMIDESSVGFYTAAVTCAGMTAFVFTAIIDSFRPVIFEHKKNNDEAGYEKNIERLYCIVIYLALAQSVVMTILAKYIIRILYGTAYTDSILALQIIVWYTTFSYMGAIRNVWILGENKQKYLWILNLGGAVLNIVLNLALIPLWGIYGAAVASLITQIFTNIVMNVIVWPLRHNNMLILKGLNPKLFINLFRGKGNGTNG